MGFTRLNLHKKILDKLEKLGFSSPTPIQNEAIPHILEGKDILACADTGTGNCGPHVTEQNNIRGPRVQTSKKMK